MAEGFIHLSEGGNRNSLEDIGNGYFLCLLSSSFFQDVRRDGLGDVTWFKMHDLVHDLALSVVGCHEVGNSNSSEMENDASKIRRLRLTMQGIPKNAKKLRTIFLQGGFVLLGPPSNKRLRVIHRLLGYPKNQITISSSYFKFKHMRYLDLTHSRLQDVHAAESIHQLYNLQTLNLSWSYNVQYILKEGIGSLINLRHLDFSSSDAIFLPESITMLTNLQTLNISSCRCISVLPANIGHLQNLSSLAISGTSIRELPDSITLLCNLSKLHFTNCMHLHALPRNFGSLTELRSLDLTNTSIREFHEPFTSNICKSECAKFGIICMFPKDINNWVELRHLESWKCYESSRMPSGIERLTRLEVLLPYIVRKEDDICSYNSTSSAIHELANLNLLRRLHIKNLENVRGGKMEAEMANLKDKLITFLDLEWKDIKEEEEEEKEEEEDVVVNNSDMVLEGLQPHPNLETLGIRDFPGSKLSKWMGSSSCLPNLVELTIFGCKRCEKLVGLGQLVRLQILKIHYMSSVKCLGKEFYYQQDKEEEGRKGFATTATSTTTLLPSLTELCINGMKNLEEWFAPDNSFPYLENVSISKCNNLKSIPDLRLWTSL